MKKTDIALIIIIVSISAGVAYWVASMTIGKANEKPITVRTIEAIDVAEQKVDEKVFSKDAINPTVEATISGTDLTSFIDDNGTAAAPNGSGASASSNAGQTSEE